MSHLEPASTLLHHPMGLFGTLICPLHWELHVSWCIQTPITIFSSIYTTWSLIQITSWLLSAYGWTSVTWPILLFIWAGIMAVFLRICTNTGRTLGPTTLLHGFVRPIVLECYLWLILSRSWDCLSLLPAVESILVLFHCLPPSIYHQGKSEKLASCITCPAVVWSLGCDTKMEPRIMSVPGLLPFDQELCGMRHTCPSFGIIFDACVVHVTWHHYLTTLCLSIMLSYPSALNRIIPICCSCPLCVGQVLLLPPSWSVWLHWAHHLMSITSSPEDTVPWLTTQRCKVDCGVFGLLFFCEHFLCKFDKFIRPSNETSKPC